MRKLNTDSWRSTALLAGAVLTAGVATTTLTTDAHADDAQTNVQVSNDQVTYDQVRATADQQLAQLKAANDAKEAQVATANEQSNAADLAQTTAQIDALNASHAAQQQQQADAIAQAQASTAASIEAQTSAANAEYQQQIDAQQQNEAIQKAANDQRYAQAVSQAAQQQRAAADIQAQYNQAVSDAANQQTQQSQSAADANNAAVANENADYQAKKAAQEATNNNNIKAAEDALANATTNAQQPHEVTVKNSVDINGRVAKSQLDVQVPAYVEKWGVRLEVPGFSGKIPVSAYTHPEFANTYYGEYPDSVIILNKAEESTPHDINELPLDFLPGLLSYDANNDHSEKVSADGLTAAQIQTLRALALSWENGFRNNVFQNYREFYNAVNNKNGFTDVAPLDLVATDLSDKVADQVVASRTKYNVDNNSHSITQSGLPADATYSKYMANAIGGLQQNLTNEFTGKTVYSVTNENLTTMQAGTLTLLNYAINLYNSMQGMYYGELVTPQNIGGHAKNLLRADIHIDAIGFQKLTDEMVNKNVSGVTDKKNPSYAVTFDHTGINIDHTSNLTKQVQQRNVWGTSTVDNQLNAIKYAQHHTETVNGTQKVTPTDAEVQQATAGAQQHVADVKAQGQQALTNLANAHQANLTKLAQQYSTAKGQVKANYDQAVKTAASVRDEALKAHGLIDLQAYKAQLDTAYQNLVQANQVAAQKLAQDRDAKIANIKASENDKLAAKIAELVPSVEPQIKALQQQHEAVVAHGDEVLAALKAENQAAYAQLEQEFNTRLAAIQQRNAAKNANQVQLGDAMVVLPSQGQPAASANGSRTNVSFPVASRPQADSQAQVVATPTIVRTATQTPVAAAPVVAAANHVTGGQTTTPESETNGAIVTLSAPVAATADQATNAGNSKTTAPQAHAKKADIATTNKQAAGKKDNGSTQEVDQSSTSIIALAATALLGTIGVTYASKKRHN